MNIQAHDVDTMKIYMAYYPSGICRVNDDDYMIVFPNMVGQPSSAFWVFKYEKEEYKPGYVHSVLTVVEDEQEVIAIVESLKARIAKETEEAIKKAADQKAIEQFIAASNRLMKGYSPAVPDNNGDDGSDACFYYEDQTYFFRQRLNPEDWQGWQLWRVSKLWDPGKISVVAVHLGSQVICWRE